MLWLLMVAYNVGLNTLPLDVQVLFSPFIGGVLVRPHKWQSAIDELGPLLSNLKVMTKAGMGDGLMGGGWMATGYGRCRQRGWLK
ncbi:hypothetical protein V6N12_006534 [Hibiscus sabdariffa]|uniref:Uncharacterized protein n=1 Tax=Hibiscus sabdariffa TaxID=183260 RepID=A0ABR2EZ60_9ROSI